MDWEFKDQDVQNYEVVVFTDEEGNEEECYILETFVVNDKDYAILVSANDVSSVFFMKVEEDEQGEYLTDIEDEGEWNTVVAAYEHLAQSEEDGVQ